MNKMWLSGIVLMASVLLFGIPSFAEDNTDYVKLEENEGYTGSGYEVREYLLYSDDDQDVDSDCTGNGIVFGGWLLQVEIEYVDFSANADLYLKDAASGADLLNGAGVNLSANNTTFTQKYITPFTEDGGYIPTDGKTYYFIGDEMGVGKSMRVRVTLSTPLR